MARVKQQEFPKVTIGTREYHDLVNVTFTDGYIEFDGVYLGQKRHIVTNAPYVYEEKV